MAYWTAVRFRVGRIADSTLSVRSGLASPEPRDGWPSLSIIVPVHNEQRVIEACAASLLAQSYPELQIVLVLDRCTDNTRALLRPHENDPRLVILEKDHCPDNWAGKCHAASVGAQHATGDWLLFTDADTQFDPDLAKASVALAVEHQSPLLSLLSSLTYTAWHECVAQPVATMALMRIFPPTRMRHHKRPRPFANGQFMLFDRSWYIRIGGHTAVKDDLLEDLAFARLIHHHGGMTTVAMADGMLRCSMYDSLDAFRRGWKRIFIEACRRKTWRMRKHAWRLMALGILAPLVQLGALAAAFAVNQMPLRMALIAMALGSVAAQIVALNLIYTLSGAPRKALLGYPLGCWIVARLIFDGARDLHRRRPVIWGGREYVLDPR